MAKLAELDTDMEEKGDGMREILKKEGFSEEIITKLEG